jgi:RNA polymerase sigma-70 factor (ECF subfamily)
VDANNLASRFERDRAGLRGVAYRMVGSLGEAEDAVQEAWLRLSRSDVSDVENLSGWLTTVVARICLDMLRARKARREDAMTPQVPEPAAPDSSADAEAELADAVGLAMLVVLERLKPRERLAFVLHDMFDLPFEEIAPIVGGTSAGARQLASRARRRVHGTTATGDLQRIRAAVEAFVTASRTGDMSALLAVLDPDVVLRSDGGPLAGGPPREVHGAAIVSRQALAAAERRRRAQIALVNGAPGIVYAPRGQLLIVLAMTVRNDRIAAIDVISDPKRLSALHIAVAYP